MLTAEQARAALEYRPETGELVWLARVDSIGRKNGRDFGNVAGRVGANGYRYVGINGKTYLAHRLIWLIVKGYWPAGCVDHANRITDDNKWSNLREATKSQNGANSRKRPSNKSGFKGVKFHKNSGKWHARITVRGKEISLGYFATPQEGGAAYETAAKIFFGEFARS